MTTWRITLDLDGLADGASASSLAGELAQHAADCWDVRPVAVEVRPTLEETA